MPPSRNMPCDIRRIFTVLRSDANLLAAHGVSPVLASSGSPLPNRVFAAGVFDGVYCMGVIQHTPDPERLMAGLPVHLKPGGRLAYNFYEEQLWRRLHVLKYGLRLITPHLPVAATLALSRFRVAAFFPLTRTLSAVTKVRILNHFIPIAAVHHPSLSREQQYAWTVLDTFDWYGARYEKRQHHRRVMDILRRAGLEGVEGQAGLTRGRRPGD